MKSIERKKIIQAIELLMDNDCKFDEAMDLLCGMVGYIYPPSKIKLTEISIEDIMKGELNTRMQEFINAKEDKP